MIGNDREEALVHWDSAVPLGRLQLEVLSMEVGKFMTCIQECCEMTYRLNPI